MRNDIQIPIGVNDFNEFVLANIHLSDTNMFSMSFYVVAPICIDNIDWGEMAWNYFEDLDVETKYNICERLNCSPQDAPDELVSECDIDEFMDFSLYPNEIEVNNETWRFESLSCGQCGFENPKFYFNKEDCEYFMHLWDVRHLHTISEKEKNELIEMIDKYNEVDIDEVFAEWIEMFWI